MFHLCVKEAKCQGTKKAISITYNWVDCTILFRQEVGDTTLLFVSCKNLEWVFRFGWNFGLYGGLEWLLCFDWNLALCGELEGLFCFAWKE